MFNNKVRLSGVIARLIIMGNSGFIIAYPSKVPVAVYHDDASVMVRNL